MALLSADAEFSRNPILGGKGQCREVTAFVLVHEAVYPLTTTDFAPLIDAVARSGCDLLFLCSYLRDSVGSRALDPRITPSGLRMVGAAMIGPQSTSVKTELGPLLNGFVNYEYWTPSPSMMFPGVGGFPPTSTRARAAEAKVDALGHYMAPLAYAQMQVVAQAITAAGTLDDVALSSFTRKTRFLYRHGEHIVRP